MIVNSHDFIDVPSQRPLESDCKFEQAGWYRLMLDVTKETVEFTLRSVETAPFVIWVLHGNSPS